MNERRWLGGFLVVAGVAFSSGGCSLIVPSPDDFTYVDLDAGLDGGLDAGLDAGTDAGCPQRCGGECTDVQTDPAHCGSCAQTCTGPDHGAATCADAVCGFACDPGYLRVVGACVAIEAPRLVAPLSTATVTSRRPTLR